MIKSNNYLNKLEGKRQLLIYIQYNNNTAIRINNKPKSQLKSNLLQVKKEKSKAIYGIKQNPIL